MKSKIIENLKQRGYTATDAEKILSAVSGAIVAVAKSETAGARVPGLGNFQVKHQAGKTGRNPNTGEQIQIAARNVLKFKASKDVIV